MWPLVGLGVPPGPGSLPSASASVRGPSAGPGGRLVGDVAPSTSQAPTTRGRRHVPPLRWGCRLPAWWWSRGLPHRWMLVGRHSSGGGGEAAEVKACHSLSGPPSFSLSTDCFSIGLFLASRVRLASCRYAGTMKRRPNRNIPKTQHRPPATGNANCPNNVSIIALLPGRNGDASAHSVPSSRTPAELGMRGRVEKGPETG